MRFSHQETTLLIVKHNVCMRKQSLHKFEDTDVHHKLTFQGPSEHLAVAIFSAIQVHW